MSKDCIVRVAVDVPLAHGFDYRTGEAPAPPIGSRVRVPFGHGERIGIVIDHPAKSEFAVSSLKSVTEQLDSEPIIEPELLALAAWAADYYHHPIGEVLSQALPSLLRQGRMASLDGEPAWALTDRGRRILQAPAAVRGPRQIEALRALSGSGIESRRALVGAGIASETLRRLAAKGWIERATIATVATPPIAPAANWPDLTPAQRSAVDDILSAPPGFAAFLLDGVTGSGKTEVYMRLIRAARAQNRQALLLVPEIGLTPQLVRRLEQRFGPCLAVVHSGLSDKGRHDAWRRAHSGAAEVVVGTRSAVFTSLPSLGLIIVDEEHDTSFKQQTGFRYSARDLSLVRARALDIKVVLGSATPSLESFYNARTGRYRRVELPARIGSAGAPAIVLVDMTKHANRRGLSTPLAQRIESHLSQSRQVILFLNRRGFAPALFCSSCAQTEQCDRCDAAMTVHARAGRLRCHHCGRERNLSWQCAGCGAERIAVGAGTQRIGDEMRAMHPEAEVALLDRDATSRKGTLDKVLAEVGAGRVDVLIGTQMLTKGHDFDNVTLVGILNADQGLFGTDFRSEERLAQTLVQVAGRAGRGVQPGEVLVQTHHPGHPLLQCLLNGGYAQFAETALRERAAAGWPPFVHIAVIRAEARERRAAFRFLERVRKLADEHARELVILGPAANAMERQNGRYRAQLLLKGAKRGALHRVLSRVDRALRADSSARRLRWSIDVDPVEL